MQDLWHVVGQEGGILESFVTKTRDEEAALTFIKKALKRHGPVETITTDRHLFDRKTCKQNCSAALAKWQSFAG